MAVWVACITCTLRSSVGNKKTSRPLGTRGCFQRPAVPPRLVSLLSLATGCARWTSVTRSCQTQVNGFRQTGTDACHLGNGCGYRIGYLPRADHAVSPFSSQVHSVARTPTGFHRCLSLWGGAACDVLVLIVAGHYGVPAHRGETKFIRVWGRAIRTVKRCALRCFLVHRPHSPRPA